MATSTGSLYADAPRFNGFGVSFKRQTRGTDRVKP